MLSISLELRSLAISGSVVVCLVLYVLWKVLDCNTLNAKALTFQSPLAVFKNYVDGYLYLFNGPNIMAIAYTKARGQPFVIQTPSNRHVMISSPAHIKEMDKAPHHQLSLHAASKEIFQPKYTMHGFNWPDQRNIDGLGFVRGLRVLLTAHLPQLLPDLRSAVKQQFSDELSKYKMIDGRTHSSIFSMMKMVITKTNTVLFFGKELSQDENFIAAALQYSQDVLIVGEIIRCTPSLLVPMVAKIMNIRQQAAVRKVFRTLSPIVEHRYKVRSLGQSENTVMVDCMQWLIDTSPKKNPWSVERMVHEILAVWFASMHQLFMASTYAIEDLCIHNEYAEPLRKEVQGPAYCHFESTAQGLPLLDSFLKESSRLSPSESISGRRKALAHFTFSDGLQVSAGDWACIPMRPMMLDPKNYSDPMTFDGFRFVNKGENSNVSATNISPFTDPSDKWFLWGCGSKTCAGRYYASTVLKLVLSHVLLNYDCELLNKEGARTMWWRSAIVPLSTTVVTFRPRLLEK